MNKHKSDSKLWREQLAKGRRVPYVDHVIDKNWDDVVIEIIARYPNKRKRVQADELFMHEREVEAVAFYDSYHNGLNKNEGGVKYMMGNTIAVGNHNALGSRRTTEQKQAQSERMMGHDHNRAKRKSLTATKGDKTWKFESCCQATQQLANEFKEKFDQGSISKACRGKYGSKRNLHIYKGIHFEYD